MALPSRRSVLLLLGGLSMAAAAVAATLWAWIRQPDPTNDAPAVSTAPSIEIVVDLRWRWTSAMPVTLTVRGAGHGPLDFVPPGKPPEHRHLLLRFVDARGRTLPHRRVDGVYRVDASDGPVTARYLVRPGGWGRHGKQGHIGRDFAVFDGRVLMLPRLDRPVEAAQIRFIRPDDWRVVGVPHQAGDWHRFGDSGTGDVGAILAGGCVAVGPFETDTRRIGAMESRVSMPSSWSAGHRRTLADKSHRVLEFFHRELGFDTGAPYAVVWTPGVDGGKVFGGSSPAGTCFEHPVERWRNWQLLAHRIAHAFDADARRAFASRADADRWFREGWASYIEIVAAARAGIEDADAAWARLHDGTYRPWLERHPGHDVPLAMEPLLTDGEAIEFVHYAKAPLVVNMLAHWVRLRGGRSLEAFMRESAREQFGHASDPEGLRETLERFTGVTLADFWEWAIHRRGTIVPLWSGAFELPKESAGSPPVAGRVGADPIPEHYLFHLARSGDFATYREIAGFVAQETALRHELAARQVELHPPAVRGRLHEIPAVLRYAIARAERDYPIGLAPPARASAAAGTQAPGNFEAQADGPVASVLRTEDAYALRPERSAVDAIVARAPDAVGACATRCLGLDRREPVRLSVRWRRAVAGALVDVLDGDRLVESREVTLAPGERITHVGLAPSPGAPAGEVLVVRVREAGSAPVERAFWRR